MNDHIIQPAEKQCYPFGDSAQVRYSIIVSSQSAYQGLLQTAYQAKFYLRVDKQHIMLTDIIT